MQNAFYMGFFLLLYWRYNPLVVGLLLDFVTANFFGVGSLAPRLPPNLEDHGPHFAWPLPFYLSDMDDPTRSLLSRQHSSPGHWGTKLLHDKAVVLVEAS
jgi:hypothetical protein